MKLKTLSGGGYESPRISEVAVRVEYGFASSIAGGGADDDGRFGDTTSGSGIKDAGYENDGYFD